MISQPLYVWYHIQYMWHSVHYIYDIYAVCMTSQPCVLITPHWAYVWQHLRYRRRHIHSIKPSHNLYDFISTSGMTSHPLYQTSHNCIFVIITSPLISHPLVHDITPTISATAYALYITSYPLLMSSHYSTYDSKTLTYETTSSMQLKIYTIPVTSQSLVCVITPIVLRASHPLFVWHHTQHRYSIICTIGDIISTLYEINPTFLWHHTHYIWHCIKAISVTISTLLMISHQTYLWDLICYICRHYILCIQQHIHFICTITATVPVSHTRTFHDITLFVYMTLHAIPV